MHTIILWNEILKKNISLIMLSLEAFMDIGKLFLRYIY